MRQPRDIWGPLGSVRAPCPKGQPTERQTQTRVVSDIDVCPSLTTHLPQHSRLSHRARTHARTRRHGKQSSCLKLPKSSSQGPARTYTPYPWLQASIYTGPSYWLDDLEISTCRFRIDMVSRWSGEGAVPGPVAHGANLGGPRTDWH
jgi:hypothetical protein